MMNALLERLAAHEELLKYLAVVVLTVIAYNFIVGSIFPDNTKENVSTKDEEEDVPDPPRNFTAEQLREFDGGVDNSGKEKSVRPVYLSVDGTVYDVSGGRDFYGPGGPYEMFAGRECGVALAKFSFDEEFLDDYGGCRNLNFGERTELEGWIEKFKYYKGYPIKGKLVPPSALPSPDRVLTFNELARFDGAVGSSTVDNEGKEGEAAAAEAKSTDAAGTATASETTTASKEGEQKQAHIPEGYATPPIYVGAGDKVFDVSFGGVTFYGPGGPYSKFAGRDCTQALAKMSFDPADFNSTDTSHLTEKQVGVLNDWIKTFEERKKYPVVGRLVKK